jgi:transcriptional regulator with PAS, ATPase and Fis domain
MVNKNLFREDLFYRINVFPVHIPPLRSRTSDIPVLARHFIEKIKADTGKDISEISADAMMMIKKYHWPGNVRQLENAIEHAFVTATGNTISIFDLPKQIREGVFTEEPEKYTSLKSQKVQEKERILAALRQTNWNRTKASKLMGISRVTLWKRIKEYDLLSEKD